MDRWEPVGDDVRAAIVQRLIDDWSRDPDLTPEKVRQLAMWAAASVRALLHELGTLRDLANEGDLMPEAEALMLDGPAEKSEGNSPKSEGNSPPWREGQAMPTKKGSIVTRWCLEVDDDGHLYVGGDAALSLAYDEWIRRGNDKLLLQILELCKGQPPITVT